MFIWVISLVGMPEIPEESKVEETKTTTKAPQKSAPVPTGPLAFTPEEAQEAMAAAQLTLNAFTNRSIGEVKALANPPPMVNWTTSLVVILLSGDPKPCDWRTAQKYMNNPNAFLENLRNFDANRITMRMIRSCQKIIRVNELSEGEIARKSVPATTLFKWVDAFVSRAKSNPIQEIVPDN